MGVFMVTDYGSRMCSRRLIYPKVCLQHVVIQFCAPCRAYAHERRRALQDDCEYNRRNTGLQAQRNRVLAGAFLATAKRYKT